MAEGDATLNDNANMVFCRGCGHSLHVTAPSCPHCGAPQQAVASAVNGDGIRRTFGNSISICYSKFASFGGRAPRAEYWWFALFNGLVMIGIAVIAGLIEPDAIKMFIGIGNLLFFFLPGLSVSVRRLHDINRSGWWFLVVAIPLIGSILLIVWFATRGNRGPNRFGPENG